MKDQQFKIFKARKKRDSTPMQYALWIACVFLFVMLK